MTEPSKYTAAMAADPSLPQTDMQEIAATRPDLLAALATNPALYPDMRKWLEEHPNPEVRSALGNAAPEANTIRGAAVASSAPVADTPPSTGRVPVADTPPSVSSRPPVADTPPSVQSRPSSTQAAGSPTRPLTAFSPPARTPAAGSEPRVFGGSGPGGGARYAAGSGLAGTAAPAVASKTRSATPVWVWFLIAIFAVALMGGAIFLAYSLSRGDSGTAEPLPAPTVDSIPSPSYSSAPTVEPVPVSEPTPEPSPELSSPSPTQDQTQDYLLIDSESQNFSCELHDDWLGCSIAERDFSNPGQDCPGRLSSIAGNGMSFELACDSDFLGIPDDHVTTLSEGESAAYGGVSCTLYGSGVDEQLACEIESSGAMFWMDRDGYSFG